jgi:hypothetical protein
LESIATSTGLLTVLVLGLSAGALLAEAGVLVPFWRAQQPDAFLAWYRENASRLLGFFGPLEVVGGVSVVAAAVTAWLGELPGKWLFLTSMALTLAVLATFPLYFQRVNARFAAGTIPSAQVGAELRRWAVWHWGRTCLAILAFLLAALAFSQLGGAPPEGVVAQTI